MTTAAPTADRLEIAELFARLARLLDEGRHEEVPTVYHRDITVRSPRGELYGLDAVTAHLERNRVEGERTQHVHGDVLLRVDGDVAEATANQVVYFYREGEPPHRTSGLRVTCATVRTPAGWRIRDMRIALAWTHER
ncbi:nuclear transport factor 2 family protein [Streptomyces sp. NPDC049590]|uniref:nuclear transport factor 2 family protein n=1 Tax=Streptomyces sp. NPDC049590 TaxID=3154834 RepID=UPI00344A32A3